MASHGIYECFQVCPGIQIIMFTQPFRHDLFDSIHRQFHFGKPRGIIHSLPHFPPLHFLRIQQIFFLVQSHPTHTIPFHHQISTHLFLYVYSFLPPFLPSFVPLFIQSIKKTNRVLNGALSRKQRIHRRTTAYAGHPRISSSILSPPMLSLHHHHHTTHLLKLAAAAVAALIRTFITIDATA